MMLANHPKSLIPAIYQNRSSFYVNCKFDKHAYDLAVEAAQEQISQADYQLWQNGSWFNGVMAVLSPDDERRFIHDLQGNAVYCHHTEGFKYVMGEVPLMAYMKFADAKRSVGGVASKITDYLIYPKKPFIMNDSDTCTGMHEHPTLLNEIKAAGYDCIVGLDNQLVWLLNKIIRP